MISRLLSRLLSQLIDSDVNDRTFFLRCIAFVMLLWLLVPVTALLLWLILQVV